MNFIRLIWSPFTLMRRISLYWVWIAIPGSEAREILIAVTTGGGRMEHLGTTLTGSQANQMILGVMKTVLA